MISTIEIYKAIGENIAKVRNSLGMKQDQLAEQVGLQRTSITNIEKGNQKIQIHMLYLIANALRVEINVLLPDEKPITSDLNSLINNSEINDIQGKQDLRQDEKEAVLRIIKSE